MFENIRKLSRFAGLHPIVGVGMIVVDWMLFGGETTSIGASWPVSLAVGIALVPPCILVQRYAFEDGWAGATGKSLLVGVITAVPTALPSIGTATLTALGIPGLLEERGESEPDEEGTDPNG